MIFNPKIKFMFSMTYDLITIGPAAHKVAKIAEKFTSKQIHVKPFQQLNPITLPSLMPICSPEIHFSEKTSPQEEIASIDPEKNIVKTKEGRKFRYKFLVYSGSESSWRNLDAYPGLSGRLNVRGSFVYGDDRYFNIAELYRRRIGTIVFTIPQGRHFGYGNYFMMHLKAAMMRKQAAQFGDLNKIRMIVINEGNCLCPFNIEHDQIIMSLFAQSEIEYINNIGHKIDYNKRQIQLSSGNSEKITYDALFHYLPFQAPFLLETAEIDPLWNNMQTLNNNKFKNIYILGNVFPTPLSVQGLEEMMKVMGINIAYELMGKKKRLLYSGTTVCDTWINQLELKQIRYDYHSQGKIGPQKMGDSPIGRMVDGYLNKLFSKQQALRIVKEDPSWQLLPQRSFQTLSTNPDQLPVLISS